MSAKSPMVLPQELRTKLGLGRDQKIKIVLSKKNGTVTTSPDVPLEKFRGTLKGMSTKGIREKRERM